MKPKDFGSKVSRSGRKFLGSLVPQQLTQKSTITYNDFRGGYNSSLGREQGGNNSSPETTDIFITKNDRIRRLPGAGPAYAITLDVAREMALQQDLDNSGEIIFFSPPAIKVLGVGTNAVSYNLGIGNNNQPFRFALFGTTLVFTNGFGVYKRVPRQVIDGATLTTRIPVAQSYATFAARFWAFGATIDGEYQPMGVAWNASSGDVEDFVGLGSGFELLISDAVEGDAIIAGRMMSLDLLGIVCKHSIWIGRRTQDPNRPAALEQRIKGDGGVSDKTVTVSPLGVTYLAETGLRAFDGNSSVLLSEAINAELLPLDVDNIRQYKVTYDWRRNWIFLHTPAQTWIYDIENTRWYKSSLLGITDSVLFREQVAGTTWDELLALGVTWDDINTIPWSAYDRKEIGLGRMLYLQQDNTGSRWFQEDELLQTYPTTNEDTVAQKAHWEFRHVPPEHASQLVTIDRINIEYTGGGDIRFYLPDDSGSMTPVFRQTLDAPPVGKLFVRSISFIHTGRGAGCQIELLSGNVEISKVQLVVDIRSEDPSKPPTALQEYIDFWEPVTPP